MRRYSFHFQYDCQIVFELRLHLDQLCCLHRRSELHGDPTDKFVRKIKNDGRLVKKPWSWLTEEEDPEDVAGACSQTWEENASEICPVSCDACDANDSIHLQHLQATVTRTHLICL